MPFVVWWHFRIYLDNGCVYLQKHMIKSLPNLMILHVTQSLMNLKRNEILVKLSSSVHTDSVVLTNLDTTITLHDWDDWSCPIRQLNWPNDAQWLKTLQLLFNFLADGEWNFLALWSCGWVSLSMWISASRPYSSPRPSFKTLLCSSSTCWRVRDIPQGKWSVSPSTAPTTNPSQVGLDHFWQWQLALMWPLDHYAALVP